MNAHILSIGNELLNGKTVNGNAAVIGRLLYEAGAPVSRVVTLPDRSEAIRAALDAAVSEADVVIVTGGLGPTHDDITKQTVSEWLGVPLVLDEAVLKRVETYLADRGRAITDLNRGQAYVPEGARVIDNPLGTAPGLHLQQGGVELFVLPGVPAEMRHMLREDVLPALERLGLAAPPEVRWFRTSGMPESDLFENLESLLDAHPDLEVAFLPRLTGVDIRVSASDEHRDELAAFREALLERVGRVVFGEELDVDIEGVLGARLTELDRTLAVAESCTGGLLQDRVTAVAGSSRYFLGGIVAYSNAAKEAILGVDGALLAEHGAVSEAVAAAMAAAVRERFGSDYALSTTGIAGPDGGSAEKPVGLVWIGLAGPEGVAARRFTFGKDRKANKIRSSQAAFNWLLATLRGNDAIVPLKDGAGEEQD